jgi:hypothetical protein
MNQNFHDTFGFVPRHNGGTGINSAIMWSVTILPYIDQAPLFKAIDPLKGGTVTAGTEANTSLPVYACPSNTSTTPGKMNYGMSDFGYQYPATPANWCAGIGRHANDTTGIACKADNPAARGVKFRDVTDGLSNTIFFGERKVTSSYVAGGVNTWSANGASQGYVGSVGFLNSSGWKINGTNASAIGSFHVGGARVLMGDGAVRFLSENINAGTAGGLMAYADGNVVQLH